MEESFIGSETGLILGIALLFIALADYVFFRYFAHRFLKRSGNALNEPMQKARGIAPYWITALIVFGLYLILQYVRNA
jgi:hypothetical protein